MSRWSRWRRRGRWVVGVFGIVGVIGADRFRVLGVGDCQSEGEGKVSLKGPSQSPRATGYKARMLVGGVLIDVNVKAE